MLEAALSPSATGISIGDTSADSMMKAERIHGRWIAMLAADDVGKAPLILDEVREHLEWGDATARDVMAAFNAAFSKALRAHIERTILAPYQITMEEFSIGAGTKLSPQL